jgi:ribonuclease HII
MVTVGIDEVGRGCWAGPLVAGAVVLKKPISGLKDSKVLTRQQREKLSEIIYKHSAAVGMGWVTAMEIDAIGLTAANELAMARALEKITIDYDQAIIDGKINYLLNNSRARAVIKADSIVPAVSAASIIAKVARDKYMADMAEQFPGYGFESHVGYGTALHLERLRLHGVTELHRRSFKPVAGLIGLAI